MTTRKDDDALTEFQKQALGRTDALTEPQKQALGRTIDNAYRRKEWDGNMRKRPNLWNCSGPTAIALVRKGMVEEVTSGGYRTVFRLTKAGVEVGTAEATKTLAKHPQLLAQEERDRKNKESNERNRRIAKIVEPFRGIKVTSEKKKVSLAALLEKELQREQYRGRSNASLDDKQWEQLGEQIETLRS